MSNQPPPAMEPLPPDLIAVLEAELGDKLGGVSAATPLAELADSLQWYEIFDTLELVLGTSIGLEQGLGLRTLGDLAHVLAPAEPA